ncbi:hypothetical protein ACQPYE_01070 [Actinosynnema sp. CA-299493]
MSWPEFSPGTFTENNEAATARPGSAGQSSAKGHDQHDHSHHTTTTVQPISLTPALDPGPFLGTGVIVCRISLVADLTVEVN